MSEFVRPSEAEVDAVRRLLDPWRKLASPVFLGLERVPERGPMLFVGNHTLFGMLDVPFLVLELYEKRGILLRSLGDHAHFKVPVWRDFVSKFGAVDGTRENCSRLMEAGEAILVFPGGAREVAKRKGELHRLVWKERVGFARLARRHGCPIVPFSAVGVEHAFDIVADADDLLRSPLGPALRRLGVRDDLLFPLVKGLGPTPLPRPERLYFRFGDPIDVNMFHADEDGVRTLRDTAANAIEAGIAELESFRSSDPYRDLGPRALAAVRRRIGGRRRPV